MPAFSTLSRRLSALALFAAIAACAVTLRALNKPETMVATMDGKEILVPAVSPRFLIDSSLAVTFAAREQALPIILTGFYIGDSHGVSIDDIRSAMVGAVKEREGATYQVIGGGSLSPASAPSVTLQFDFWSEGGVRSDLILRCATYDAASRPNGATDHQVASSRSTFLDAKYLREHVQQLLNQAAELRCPYGVAAPARATPGRGATGGRGITLERAQAVAGDIERLVVSVDTVHLRVGDKLNGAAEPRVIAMRADGSVAKQWVPLYSVEDFSIARYGRAGLEALAPGTTRVTVQAFGATPTADHPPAAASYVVVVTP